jgi:hypothetical protein
LQSYQANGLLQVADERLILFVQATPLDILQAQRYSLPFLARSDNPGIAQGLARLAENLTGDYLLLLENDWLLVESAQQLVAQLEAAMALLASNTVDIVKLRHRKRYGDPLYSRQFEGKELTAPEHLLECIHWMDHPEQAFPDKIQRIEKNHQVFYQTTSAYANYTNNPCLMRRQFFMETIYPYCTGDLEQTIQPVWPGMKISLCHGDGLFTHARLDRDHPSRYKHWKKRWYQLYTGLGSYFYR